MQQETCTEAESDDSSQKDVVGIVPIEHRRRNRRGHGGHGPLTFQPKLFLKSFLS